MWCLETIVDINKEKTAPFELTLQEYNFLKTETRNYRPTEIKKLSRPILLNDQIFSHCILEKGAAPEVLKVLKSRDFFHVAELKMFLL